MSSPPPSKRRRVTLDRDISPPQLRRKKDDNAAFQTPKKRSEGVESQYNRVEIISWNVNGITHLLPKTQRSIKSFFNRRSPSPQGESDEVEILQSPLRSFLKRHSWPAMLCLQEVKISPKDEATKRAVFKAANDSSSDGPLYQAHFSLPRDKHNAKGFGGKVYGVCTLIRDDLPPDSKTTEVDWDLEGRVLVTTIDDWKLVVINGYWVNGTTNPYRDSESGEVTGTRHDRKRLFHSLMLEEVQLHENNGFNVVLVGDMNIARTPIDGYPGIRLGLEHVKNRADFNAKFFDDEKGMRGIDTWRHVRGDKRGFTYHGEPAEEWGRSCDRVDLGIVSRGLVGNGALVDAEIYENVDERGESDHCPLSVVLNKEKLEGARVSS